MVDEENDFVEEITEEIDKHFCISEKRIETKKRPNTTASKDILIELAKLFYILKNFSKLHSMPKNHLIPHQWTDQSQFSARVWSDYQMENENEVSVKKKEMVDVLKVTTRPYWLVKKSNGTEGYIPCTILEPVD